MLFIRTENSLSSAAAMYESVRRRRNVGTEKYCVKLEYFKTTTFLLDLDKVSF